MKLARLTNLCVHGMLAFGILGTLPAVAAEMQAAVVTGGKLVLKTNVPVPEPKADEVRIKLRAAAVNPADFNARGDREGVVPGLDAAGVVDAVGSGITLWKKGDEVIASAPSGTYAQYVVVPETRVARKPKSLSFDEAAGIPVVGETAYRTLSEVAKVQAGQRVLVHGGAGGVGSAAVQIAKARGAYVIATASPRNHDFLRSIGASEVIDYNTEKFEEKVKDLDIVVNTVDAATGERSIGIIKAGGVLASVVALPDAAKCAAANVRCERPNRNVGPTVADMLTKVNELVDAGQYRVNVDATFPLANAEAAWDVGRKRATRGKVIIQIPQ